MRFLLVGYTFAMGDFIPLLYIFLQKYLVPLIYVIGLMNLIYGLIEYFVAGRTGGDEGRAQNGRLYLLRSLSWFFVGLVVYSVIAFFGWISSGVLNNINLNDDSSGNAGVDYSDRTNVLEVPNVPRGNDD